ncbi:T9SS type A sorting domain-containing protein [Pontibacter sp. Tf4]|uniref:LamG-like jellyroll fold domain-containing protein n=1 Tax=Pontibacter sp. Tf4 TaxID=2761620 RepID=UPI0016238A54|nr:LamG-like jellyroll fold domain-containing protein [Pontibacter sp. Tf4]MBB6610719.1 T9SS type A sorting domain-containing protein [Pontibacter sp. Tf4]
MTYSYSYRYISSYFSDITQRIRRSMAGTNRLQTTLVALTAILLLLTTTVVQAKCPPGIVHYFPLDETTGSTYADNVSPVTASCTSCPTPISSMFAGAQKFNGTSNGLIITEKQGFEWGRYDSFTIEMWVQVTGSAPDNRVIMGRSAKDSGMSWWVGVDPEGYAVFELYDMQRKGFWIEKSGKKINDGKWHHVVVMRHGMHMRNRLYIDGYKVAEYRYDYTADFLSEAPVTIGYLDLSHGYRYNGAVDEIIVYNRALEENEVRARFGEGASVYCGTKTIAPTITSEPVTFGVVGQPYLYDVQATGNPAPTYSFNSNPPGMSINASTGQITWTPAAAGRQNVTVLVKNSAGQAEQTFTIDVKNAIDKSVGLRHHWMLHETSGLHFKDYYTPYDATCESGARPSPVPGVISGGQRFNGTEAGLDVKESYNFNWDPTESFTIELWARTTTNPSDNQVMIGRQAMDSDMHWWIGISTTGQAVFDLRDLQWQGTMVEKSGPKLNDGKWHQVVAVRDGAAGVNRLYVDGEKVGESSFRYQNSFASLSPVNIGYLNLAGKYRYQGDLDEVKLFGRALTDEEIRQNYETVYDGIVELIKFEGEFVNNTVQLNWETQTETDLSHFVVERSENGLDFTEIGTVQANGSSSVLLAYNYTDEQPLKGTSYYRLRIVKESGAHTFSNIVIIEFGGTVLSSFYLYPNPIQHGDLKVEVNNLVPDEKVTFMLSDLSGRRMMVKELQVEGDGTIKLTEVIPETMAGGLYMVTIVTKAKTLSRKLVVLD